jgi:hypothetical protein
MAPEVAHRPVYLLLDGLYPDFVRAGRVALLDPQFQVRIGRAGLGLGGRRRDYRRPEDLPRGGRKDRQEGREAANCIKFVTFSPKYVTKDMIVF